MKNSKVLLLTESGQEFLGFYCQCDLSWLLAEGCWQGEVEVNIT
jgi:hypothetical protein